MCCAAASAPAYWPPPRKPLPTYPTPRTCRLQNFKDAEDVLADYPLPFDAIEQPEAPAAGGRKGAAKTPARGRRAAAADDSSDEEEEEGPQMPQSSDDEEEGEVSWGARPRMAVGGRQARMYVFEGSNVCV